MTRTQAVHIVKHSRTSGFGDKNKILTVNIFVLQSMYCTPSNRHQKNSLTSAAAFPKPFFFVQYFKEECKPAGTPPPPPSKPLPGPRHRSVRRTTKDSAAACSSGRCAFSAKGTTHEARETATRTSFSHELSQTESVKSSLGRGEGREP